MKILGVIPARFASTRFPGKPLALIGAKSMVEQVYLRCKESSVFEQIVVATDNQEIADCASKFGALVVFTNPNHPSGTDRCFEALSLVHDAFDAIINVQGDEPFIDPLSITKVADRLRKGAEIATLAVKVLDETVLHDSNKVKAILAENDTALYFSRAAIPFLREHPLAEWLNYADYFVHLGIYGFSASVIPKLAKLSPSNLEKIECLEQLRWLENGFKIHIDIVQNSPFGIDTPEDLVLVNNLYSQGKINF